MGLERPHRTPAVDHAVFCGLPNEVALIIILCMVVVLPEYVQPAMLKPAGNLFLLLTRMQTGLALTSLASMPAIHGSLCLNRAALSIVITPA